MFKVVGGWVICNVTTAEEQLNSGWRRQVTEALLTHPRLRYPHPLRETLDYVMASYTTDQSHPGSAASSLNHGFNVSENTFSPVSRSTLQVESRKTAPGPLNSPAYHTYTLTVCYVHSICCCRSGRFDSGICSRILVSLPRSINPHPLSSRSARIPVSFSKISRSQQVLGNDYDPHGSQIIVPSAPPAPIGSFSYTRMGGIWHGPTAGPTRRCLYPKACPFVISRGRSSAGKELVVRYPVPWMSLRRVLPTRTFILPHAGPVTYLLCGWF